MSKIRNKYNIKIFISQEGFRQGTSNFRILSTSLHFNSNEKGIIKVCVLRPGEDFIAFLLIIII